MTLECLCMLHLCLSEIIESDQAIFVTSENQLVVICKITVKTCSCLMVGKDARLHLLTFQVKDSDLMIRAAGHQD